MEKTEEQQRGRDYYINLPIPELAAAIDEIAEKYRKRATKELKALYKKIYIDLAQVYNKRTGHKSFNETI